MMFPMVTQTEAQRTAARAEKTAELLAVRERIWELSRIHGATFVGVHLATAWRALGWAIQEYEDGTP